MWKRRRQQMAERIQQGLDYFEQLAVDPDRNISALAAKVWLPKARVIHLLRLSQLAPEILEDVCDLTRTSPIPSGHQLREISRIKAHDLQRQRYAQFLQGQVPLQFDTSVKPAHPKGFQSLFERAHRYQALLQSGNYASLTAIGRAERLDSAYIGQILALLQLAPDIIARLDVPAEQSIAGLTHKDLRKVARIRDVEDQRRVFEQVVARRLEERSARSVSQSDGSHPLSTP